MADILGIIGSPRRNGNTHLLVARILAGAESAGAKTSMLFLKDFTIRECDGCHRCWQGRRCPKTDDMAEIYPRIIHADVIVFGTPVYWYGPTGLMKLLIDRFVYFNCPTNRAKIAGKPAVVAVPYEDTDPATARPLVEFFEKCLAYLEMNLVARIVVPGVSKRGDIRQKLDALDQAFQLGARLATGG